jgi:hypothetical protein
MNIVTINDLISLSWDPGSAKAILTIGEEDHNLSPAELSKLENAAEAARRQLKGGPDVRKKFRPEQQQQQ